MFSLAVFPFLITFFYGLEDAGLLDCTDEYDLFALHYVFIPRLQHQLNVFREGYSHHRIRGQKNRSPYQLWIEGIAHLDGDENAITGATENTFAVSTFLFTISCCNSCLLL